MVKKATPPSKSYKTIPMAFLVGGLICVLGQLLINGFMAAGLDEKLAPVAASSTLVRRPRCSLGSISLITIAKQAGAGTLVPITGFANAVSSPALDTSPRVWCWASVRNVSSSPGR